MKKIIITIIALSFSTNYFAQKETPIPTTKKTMNDVYNASELTFYGYDFTNFRLVEPDRINEGAAIRDIQFSAWNAYVINEITMNKLAKWFKKSAINYSPVALTILNSKVEDGNVVARLPFVVEQDAIKRSIATYEKPKNAENKIGMVINVESFLESKKQATAYVTFFEISTGAVISMQEVRVSKPFGMDGVMLHGISKFWGQSCLDILRTYFDDTYKRGY